MRCDASLCERDRSAKYRLLTHLQHRYDVARREGSGILVVHDGGIFTCSLDVGTAADEIPERDSVDATAADGGSPKDNSKNTKRQLHAW